MATIANFIKENSIENLNIKNTLMVNPFKKYKPLDQGNKKLNENIFSFSLIPVATCGTECKGCYDLRSLRYPSVQMKRKYNTWLAINNKTFLKNAIINQITKSKKVEFVRIHVGGDFFSLDYVAMWGEICQTVLALKPDVKFYTYTKSKFSDEISMGGINVVESTIKGLGYNFAKKERLDKFVAKKGNEDYTICPDTVKETTANTKCGVTCTACMTTKKVLFVAH